MAFSNGNEIPGVKFLIFRISFFLKFKANKIWRYDENKYYDEKMNSLSSEKFPIKQTHLGILKLKIRITGFQKNSSIYPQVSKKWNYVKRCKCLLVKSDIICCCFVWTICNFSLFCIKVREIYFKCGCLTDCLHLSYLYFLRVLSYLILNRYPYSSLNN